MSLKSFFAKTLEHLFGEPLKADAGKQPKKRTLNPNARKNGHWVKWQLETYTGDCVAVVKVPENLPLDTAHKSVKGYLALRFGHGHFSTRIFASARTVHVRPKWA